MTTSGRHDEVRNNKSRRDEISNSWGWNPQQGMWNREKSRRDDIYRIIEFDYLKKDRASSIPTIWKSLIILYFINENHRSGLSTALRGKHPELVICHPFRAWSILVKEEHVISRSEATRNPLCVRNDERVDFSLRSKWLSFLWVIIHFLLFLAKYLKFFQLRASVHLEHYLW